MEVHQQIDFKSFLSNAFINGNYTSDDIIAFLLPVFEEVKSFHDEGKVAPFQIEESLFVNNTVLDIDENYRREPLHNFSALQNLFKDYSTKAIDVSGFSKIEIDIAQNDFKNTNLNIYKENDKPLERPAFLLGYKSYEILINHHDALTDIFCLGLILSSVTLSLNLYEEDDLEQFVTFRTNPAKLNHNIHPTIAALIIEMTELDRTKRAKDLLDIIHRLKNYRNYDPDKQTDLSNISGWINKDTSERNNFILNKLKNRLFDVSKRNRLLYYKPNARFLNLTISSVPALLHYQNISISSLFIWNDEISNKVKSMKEIALNNYLRFEDHSYLPSTLNKIKTEAQHDINEYGFSRLKLVIAFLNWHNLKEDKLDRIQSPLLLIPVELKKKKGLKEEIFTLQVLDNEAEVNPVLANTLKELYNIKLPDFIDLDETSEQEFYEQVKQQIDAVNQGIQLKLIEKPRIKLIHSIAKQTINVYNKRLRKKGTHLPSYKNIEYSYQAENYRPLGLEIFKQRIKPYSSFLEFLVDTDIKTETKSLSSKATEQERTLYQLEESENNPYSWDVDTCNMVLGNFNYKKMSLVRDYNTVMEEKISSTVFTNLFNAQPKKIQEQKFSLTDATKWHHIITADPTQTKAILKSRNNESYIIQGPPGTGKSQTITNLIADFIAQNKTVLFVCEKRAALDVVYNRLKQQHLHELCCYIHDSQNDKRSFVKELKEVYEDFMKNKMDLKAIASTRNECIKKIEEQIKLIEIFHTTNHNQYAFAGIRVRDLINKLIELKPTQTQLSATTQEKLPHYNEWLQHQNIIKELLEALDNIGVEPVFAEHSFCNITDAVFAKENPIGFLQHTLNKAKSLLADVELVLNQNNIPNALTQKLASVKTLVQQAMLMEPFAQNNNLALVNANSATSKNFEKEIKTIKNYQQQLDGKKETNKNWVNKFSETDTINALQIAIKHEQSFFKFLNGSWRTLKKQISSSYNFQQHSVKPTIQSVLQTLKEEYDASKQLLQQKENFNQQYNLDNVDTALLSLDRLRQKYDTAEVQYLSQQKDAANIITKLSKLNEVLHLLEVQLYQTIINHNEKEISVLKDDVDSICLNIDSLQDLLPALQQFTTLPNNIKETIRSLTLSPKQLETAIAFKTWQFLLQSSKEYANTNYSIIEKSVTTLQTEYSKLLSLNALLIRAEKRNKFLANVELSLKAVSQLNNEEKELKKKYNEGRKILENEFGKSMRFKSIRELSAKESNLILKDIKPVWLMSPLSVSDCLPVNTNSFDVVIFDEASQITLEEGVPATFRANQTIIVGDEMQMPPTNFFTTKAQDPDDIELLDNEDDEILSNDVDSLLVQGARKLDSVMLGWHYRSRYEALISYSNYAFYNKQLLTIPDKTISQKERTEINVATTADANTNWQEILNRSISYHYLSNSIYEKRCNEHEATYIALLVRQLLLNKVEDSIGIVAFSQEQQATIEDALETLATTDKEFEALLEAAYNKTVDDQFVGLIVKNLENIQGDERDIIIMSVCYGFDNNKKMLMNFGPINKKGGEKRLNVIFSRAKKHMAIISSIKHNNITNEYNEGANYLKRFLHYAELVSNGNMQTARTVLANLSNNNLQQKIQNNQELILIEIEKALCSKGFITQLNVGESTFKCSLAIKQSENDEQYSVGIIVDDEHHYTNDNWLENYFQRPATLSTFGWKVVNIFAKDWLQHPDKVLEKISQTLNNTNENFSNETIDINQQDFFSSSNSFASKENSLISEDCEFTTLHYIDEQSQKFWEVGCVENKLIIRFGRINAKGQTQFKTFADKETAEKEKQKMIVDKMNKGYKIFTNSHQ